MNSFSDTDHTWFRRRLPDHLLDLLVEDERERFEQHARGCEPCARMLESAQGARADWWDGTGHPPVGVLLKWNTKVRGDRVQELVHAHVAHCESCQQDVEDLLGVPVPRMRVLPIAPVPRWRSIPVLSRGLAVAAGLVAVAAATQLIRDRIETPPVAPHSVSTTPDASDGVMGGTLSVVRPPTSDAPPTADQVAGPVTLASADRGAETVATMLRIATGVTHVSLTLPILIVSDDTPITLELRDAADAVVSRQKLPAEQALRPGGVLLPVEGLAAGAYRLLVSWTDKAIGETTTREFALDVRTSR